MASMRIIFAIRQIPLLVLSRENGNMLYGDHVGVIVTLK